MSGKPNRKRGIIIGGLGFIVLVSCVACAALVYLAGNFFRPTPETPAALASAVPISPLNMEKLEPLYQFTVTDTVSSIVWSPDSRLLAIRAERWPLIPIGEPIVRDSIHLWDSVQGNGRELFSTSSGLGIGGYRISSVAFSSDGQILAFQTGSSIILWDVQQDRELRTLTDVGSLDAAAATGRTAPIVPKIPEAKSTVLSPDEKIAAASFSDSQNPNVPRLELFDAASGNELRTIAGSPDVIFSHNSKMIASLDWSKMVEKEAPILLSDVESGQLLQRLEGNVYGKSIAFSPDDKLMAGLNYAASQVYVWNVNSGNRITLKRGLNNPNSIEFSPDGRFLAIGMKEGVVQVWGVRP